MRRPHATRPAASQDAGFSISGGTPGHGTTVQKRYGAARAPGDGGGVPGHSTRVQKRYGGLSQPIVQRKGEDIGSAEVAKVAARGVSEGAGSLPHLESIQHSFGKHDVSGVRAHRGSAAAAASEALGAEAYTTGNDVAFRSAPDLFTAAHEATHVVQQRTGVQLKGGVGQPGDCYEQHADEVAERVVAGESSEDLLDKVDGGGVVA